MAARIAGFVTREQADLGRPTSVSRNVEPHRGGLGVHYGGAAGPPATHAGCIARWRSWWDFHTRSVASGGRGWADIAYSFGYCDHGFVFAGRGFGVRTAANGTNDGNQRYLAACWIGGGDAKPSPAAEDALEWMVAEVRRLGAGREVRPHRWFKSTDCPGTALVGVAGRLHNAQLATTTPTVQEDDMLTPEQAEQLEKAAYRTAVLQDRLAEVRELASLAAYRGMVSQERLATLQGAVAGIAQADPSKIAAAIPTDLAQRVVDELVARLTKEKA